MINLLQDGMALIIEATKHTNAFPSNASRNLYSAYPAFNRAIQKHSDQILSTIAKVVKLQHIKGNIQRYLQQTKTNSNFKFPISYKFEFSLKT